MSPKNIKHVEDIYALAGQGAMEIAYKLGVHSRTVERWPKSGIPEKYWGKLRDLYGVSPHDCLRLNAKIKGYRAA